MIKTPLEPMLLENRMINAEVSLIDELTKFLKEAYAKTMADLELKVENFKTEVEISITENTFGTLMGFMHLLEKRKAEIIRDAKESSSTNNSDDGRSNVFKNVANGLRKALKKYH